jgi:hypothetical protein
MKATFRRHVCLLDGFQCLSRCSGANNKITYPQIECMNLLYEPTFLFFLLKENVTYIELQMSFNVCAPVGLTY